MTKREWKGVIVAREDELIKQIKNGRRECLDELISLYYPAILRYCLWHMPDRESALDATQETFLKLVRFLDKYENRGTFRSFLYRIAANTCIDFKRRQTVTEPLSETMAETICSPENGYQAVEDRQLLAAALTHLDDTARELVLLRFGQRTVLQKKENQNAGLGGGGRSCPADTHETVPRYKGSPAKAEQDGTGKTDKNRLQAADNRHKEQAGTCAVHEQQPLQ